MSARRPPFRDGAPEERNGADASARERAREAPAAMPRTPPCPFCEREETEVMSAFGSHASVSTYWCRGCRSPFEIVKWR